VASAGPYASPPRSRQITTPAPHHSIFTGVFTDALPAAQPTASKHWRHSTAHNTPWLIQYRVPWLHWQHWCTVKHTSSTNGTLACGKIGTRLSYMTLLACITCTQCTDVGCCSRCHMQRGLFVKLCRSVFSLQHWTLQVMELIKMTCGRGRPEWHRGPNPLTERGTLGKNRVAWYGSQSG